jgi:hypothetical protein
VRSVARGTGDDRQARSADRTWVLGWAVPVVYRRRPSHVVWRDGAGRGVGAGLESCHSSIFFVDSEIGVGVV